MSGISSEKITRLQSLDEREKIVLDFIMADQNVKIRDVADKMAISEVYARGFLTNVYKKLGVPETERDKRGYIFREYSEAYKKPTIIVKPPPSKVDWELFFLIFFFIAIGEGVVIFFLLVGVLK